MSLEIQHTNCELVPRRPCQCQHCTPMQLFYFIEVTLVLLLRNLASCSHAFLTSNFIGSRSWAWPKGWITANEGWNALSLGQLQCWFEPNRASGSLRYSVKIDSAEHSMPAVWSSFMSPTNNLVYSFAWVCNSACGHARRSRLFVYLFIRLRRPGVEPYVWDANFGIFSLSPWFAFLQHWSCS